MKNMLGVCFMVCLAVVGHCSKTSADEDKAIELISSPSPAVVRDPHEMERRKYVGESMYRVENGEVVCYYHSATSVPNCKWK